ncbi:hypothetical protein D3C72_2534950 [compost metagenome]
MDRAEVGGDLLHHALDLGFVGDVADIGARLDTVGLAGVDCQLQLFRVEID